MVLDLLHTTTEKIAIGPFHHQMAERLSVCMPQKGTVVGTCSTAAAWEWQVAERWFW